MLPCTAKLEIERRMNCLFITAGGRKVRTFWTCQAVIITGRQLCLVIVGPPTPQPPFPQGGKGGYYYQYFVLFFIDSKVYRYRHMWRRELVFSLSPRRGPQTKGLVKSAWLSYPIWWKSGRGVIWHAQVRVDAKIHKHSRYLKEFQTLLQHGRAFGIAEP
jgi:hypothetical protein